MMARFRDLLSNKRAVTAAALAVALILLIILRQPLPALVLVTFVAAISGFRLLGKDEVKRQGTQGLAAALSSVALLIGAYWYFVERRGVPKVNVEPEGKAWAIPGNGLLVRAAVQITNVGVSAVRLDREIPVEIEIGQVVPPDGKQARLLIQAMSTGNAKGRRDFDLLQTDKWPLRASNYGGIESIIESGESEKLYYKAVIPCRDGMVLALTAKVPKKLSWFDGLFEPNKQRDYWTAQSIIESKAECQGEAGQ